MHTTQWRGERRLFFTILFRTPLRVLRLSVQTKPAVSSDNSGTYLIYQAKNNCKSTFNPGTLLTARFAWIGWCVFSWSVQSCLSKKWYCFVPKVTPLQRFPRAINHNNDGFFLSWKGPVGCVCCARRWRHLSAATSTRTKEESACSERTARADNDTWVPAMFCFATSMCHSLPIVGNYLKKKTPFPSATFTTNLTSHSNVTHTSNQIPSLRFQRISVGDALRGLLGNTVEETSPGHYTWTTVNDRPPSPRPRSGFLLKCRVDVQVSLCDFNSMRKLIKTRSAVFEQLMKLFVDVSATSVLLKNITHPKKQLSGALLTTSKRIS